MFTVKKMFFLAGTAIYSACIWATTIQVNVDIPDVDEGKTSSSTTAISENEKKPPEPPAPEAAEPKRLVRYFCKQWKDEEWEKMWWSMTPKFRKKVSLKRFTERFTDDAENNGGLTDENLSDEFETNAGVGMKVELKFKFKRAKPRIVKAEVERISGGQYRLTECALIPVDLKDL